MYKNITNIKAIIFDMDGTLVDSEIFTEKSIEKLLEENTIEAKGLDLKQFHGITWEAITDILTNLYPRLRDIPVNNFLQDSFHDLFISGQMHYIPGADTFFHQAASVLKTAIATSSNKESVEYLLDRMKIRETITTWLSAENYTHSKPHPECYLKTAEKLKADPAHCLVFEDSIPGLMSGQAAGMQTVGITKNALDLEAINKHSTITIDDYTKLPENFLKLITS